MCLFNYLWRRPLASLLAPQLPHLLPPLLHQLLVLRDPQLLPVHDASALRARAVAVVCIII